MSIDDQYKKYSVRVNNGSGCLIQPNTKEYTYVITAKHNLSEEIKEDKLPQIQTVKNESIEVIKIFPHPNLDLAIVKVEFQEGIELYIKKSIPDYSRLILYGFPEVKGGDKYQAKKVITELIEKPDTFYVLKSSSFAGQGDVVGFSGCGVFQEINNEIYLSGIEYQMDSQGDEEARVNIYPIRLIGQIIADNEGQLEEILPNYMCDFGCLLDSSFQDLNDELTKVTKNILVSIGKSQLQRERLTPEQILKKFKAEISLDDEFLPEHHFNLWLGWLEFLTLCVIEKEEFDSQDTYEVFFSKVMKNRKFFFINHGNWTTKIKKIYQSDLTGLDNQGVIIANSYPFNGGRKIIPRNLIPHIANIPKSEMRIDSGVTDPYGFGIMHLSYIIDKILENGDLASYGYHQEQDILNTIQGILIKVYGNCN